MSYRASRMLTLNQGTSWFLHSTVSFEGLVGFRHSNTVVHEEITHTHTHTHTHMHESTCIFHRITTIHTVSRDVYPLRLVQKTYIIPVNNNHKYLYPF